MLGSILRGGLRNRLHRGDLRCRVVAEVGVLPVGPAHVVARKSAPPTIVRHAPAYGTVHPSICFGSPDAIGSGSERSAQGIEEGIRRHYHDVLTQCFGLVPRILIGYTV